MLHLPRHVLREDRQAGDRGASHGRELPDPSHHHPPTRMEVDLKLIKEAYQKRNTLDRAVAATTRACSSYSWGTNDQPSRVALSLPSSALCRLWPNRIINLLCAAVSRWGREVVSSVLVLSLQLAQW